MKVIKTTEELLALRDDAGRIEINDACLIACGVPFSVGRKISGLNVRGNLYVGGNLDVRGNLYVGGNLDVGDRS